MKNAWDEVVRMASVGVEEAYKAKELLLQLQSDIDKITTHIPVEIHYTVHYLHMTIITCDIPCDEFMTTAPEQYG